MNNEEIAPALPPEEWAEYLADRLIKLPRYLMDSDRHWLGAVALQGQPFGFTWADVEALRAWDPRNYEAELRNLADRIAALLPPRETR